MIDEPYDELTADTIMFCSGKVYYDLVERRKALGISPDTVRIVRLEQIAPFPGIEVENVLKRNKNASKLVWVQEEHQNMGAFSFVEPKLNDVASRLAMKLSVSYAGRATSETPVTANRVRLMEEKNEFLDQAFKQ